MGLYLQLITLITLYASLIFDSFVCNSMNFVPNDRILNKLDGLEYVVKSAYVQFKEYSDFRIMAVRPLEGGKARILSPKNAVKLEGLEDARSKCRELGILPIRNKTLWVRDVNKRNK